MSRFGALYDLNVGPMDHLHREDSNLGMQPGVPVVLPSSFSGSPRAVQQNYQDAMSIVAKYDRPDLFLTYTCNPRSRVITENLRPGERPEHRPDLVSRVYKLHLTQLLHDIKDEHVAWCASHSCACHQISKPKLCVHGKRHMQEEVS